MKWFKNSLLLMLAMLVPIICISQTISDTFSECHNINGSSITLINSLVTKDGELNINTTDLHIINTTIKGRLTAKTELQVGTQIWMVANLNEGNKYCYNNKELNCSIYGGLYLWNTAICPNGWHIPSNAEFTELFNYLGGISLAGGKLKEAGYVHWLLPNQNATNESSFSAIPGGVRWHTGIYYYMGNDANYWTSTEINNTTAIYAGASYSIKSATNGQFYKTEGLSVRCIKN
jgi:uncharacterized protein (TIGR02145 family)